MDGNVIRILIVGIGAGAIRLAVPLFLPAIGEVYSERSGVINLGLEGMILVGASGGLIGAYFSQSIWAGLAVGIVLGMLMSLIVGYLAVILGVNQIITGFGLNFLGTGLSVFLYRVVFGIRSIPPSVTPMPPWNVPLLSSIPIMGPILFEQSPPIYLAYAIVPIASVILYRTHLGLAIRATGENAEAADARGINVYGVRFACVLVAGASAGLAGAFLSLVFQGTFLPDMSAGRGFVALAVVMLASWDPAKAVLAALLFGGAYGLQLRMQELNPAVSYELLLALPYLLAIIVLVLASHAGKVPAESGLPYKRGHVE